MMLALVGFLAACEEGFRVFVLNEHAQPVLVYFGDAALGPGRQYLVAGNSQVGTWSRLGNAAAVVVVFDSATCDVLAKTGPMELANNVLITIPESGSVVIGDGSLDNPIHWVPESTPPTACTAP